MNAEEFERKLAVCSDENELANLAEEVCDALLSGLKVPLAKQFIARLLESGLKITAESENSGFLEPLMYVYNQKALEIARMLFEKIGVPDQLFTHLQFKVDFDCYNEPYVMKLYLLAAAYVWETKETYIKMSENLYEEMFDPQECYTTLESKHKKCTLTPAIFKKIEKYDFMVEMLPQKISRPERVIHIFDKKSKIEVAIYD